jgi:hypothetical protein
MSAPLLSVGDATVWPSIWGGHIVDNGSAFPQHFNDRRTAYAEAAARSLNSPPVGDPVSSVRGSGVATADGAGFISGATPPPSPGTVPGSCPASQAVGSGTTDSSSRRSGASRAEGVVGATVEVPSPPREALGVSS